MRTNTTHFRCGKDRTLAGFGNVTVAPMRVMKLTSCCSAMLGIFLAGSMPTPIPSADLAQALAEVKDRPWPELSRGKPITTVKLALMLKRFRIFPGTKRDGNTTFKGYDRNRFDDAFDRYASRRLVTSSQNRVLPVVSGKLATISTRHNGLRCYEFKRNENCPLYL